MNRLAETGPVRLTGRKLSKPSNIGLRRRRKPLQRLFPNFRKLSLRSAAHREADFHWVPPAKVSKTIFGPYDSGRRQTKPPERIKWQLLTTSLTRSWMSARYPTS